jgi:Holliday junction DNA helicase RuvB
MEDFRVDITVEGGMHARTVSINLKPFTMIGATTRAGMVSSPLRSRFGIGHHLKHYSSDDLLLIVERSASLLGLSGIAPGSLEQIALRSRGTPRVANRLLRRVRDYAQVRTSGKITRACIDEALALEGVDHVGLDELDRAYMRVIATTYRGGPVGLEAVAATMNEDAGTLDDVVEPFLLQLGFVARTRRGRQLTKAGATHIGMPQAAPAPVDADDLFDQ